MNQIIKLFVRLYRRFRTINRTVSTIFFLAIFTVVSMDLDLVKIPEFVSVRSEIGIIVYKLCFAYITSFIFYFINVHIQNYNAKVKTSLYVNNKIYKFGELSKGLLKCLTTSAGVVVPEGVQLSETEIKNICFKVNPCQAVSLKYGRFSFKYNDYHALLAFIDSETKRIVKDLLAVKDSLDSELMMLLTHVENCTENHMNFGKGLQVKMEVNLGSYADGIYHFNKLCQSIHKYLHEDKTFNYYKIEHQENEKAKNLK